MRILFFYFTEFSLVGGVETVIVSMAKALKERGHDTGILDLAPAERPRRLVYGDIPIWSIAGPSFPTLRRPRSWASYLRSLWQFEKVCQEFRPDIVHVHFPLGQCIPLAGARVLPHRWRVVTTVHNSDIRVSPHSEPRLRPWQERLFRMSNAVTSVSESLLKLTLSLYPSVSSKGIVIHNGVEPWWFDRDNMEGKTQERYALFVGRLHPIKAADMLLEAWGRIHLNLQGMQLWLAGSGPELAKLHGLIRELELQSSVRFLGEQSPTELRRLYRAAQFVVLPSRSEGFPMVLLEAGACGAICIGTSVPGISEIIFDGINGLLVEPQSPDALAEAILRAATLPEEERHSMSVAARQRVRTCFSQESMISRYLDVYRTVIERDR